MMFATAQQLAAYPGGATIPSPDRLLLRATGLVRRATILAVYPVSMLDGSPLDSSVATALANATCETVVAWTEAGIDPSTEGLVEVAVKRVASKSMGGRSVSYDNSASTGVTEARAALLNRLTPMAYQYLVDAGLTRRGVYVV